MTAAHGLARRHVRPGLAVVLAAAFGAGCATPEPEPKRQPPASYVVLLENEDGSTGAVSVTGPRGTVVLNRARQAVRIDAGQTDAAFDTEPGRIARDFATADATRPRAPEVYRLYFATGAATLAPASQRLIDEILAQARQRPGADVSIIGHTDTAGDAATNERLGRERAEWVARLLRARGLTAVEVTVASHGEADLLVPTPDETPEARNRRVEVFVR